MYSFDIGICPRSIVCNHLAAAHRCIRRNLGCVPEEVVQFSQEEMHGFFQSLHKTVKVAEVQAP